MQTLTQAQIEAIKSTDQSVATKIEVYSSDRTTLLTTIEEGVSFSVNAARKRKCNRTFDMTIADPDGVYTPDPQNPTNNTFWPELRWVKLYADVGQNDPYLMFRGDNTTDYVIKNPVSNFPTTQITAEFRGTAQDFNDGIISYASSDAMSNDFLIYNSSNITVFVANNSVATGIAINDNKEHHIAVTWRSSDGEVKLYIDGMLSFTGTLSTGLSITQGGSFVVGQEQDAVGGGFDASQAYKGKMRDVRIWNVVRTQSEIQQNMNIKLAGTESGLILNWLFNEGTGSIAEDISANSNDGTIFGALWFTGIQLGEFNIDTVSPVPGQLRITGRDGAKRVSAAQPDTTTTYADSSAAQSANLIAGVTASSGMGIGAQLKAQASIAAQGKAGDTWHSNMVSSSPYNALDNNTDNKFNFQMRFGLIYSTVYCYLTIDLQTTATLQDVEPIVSAGTVSAIQKSTNGTTWTTYNAGDSARYLKITLTQSSYTYQNYQYYYNFWIDEINILAGNAAVAGNVIDGDVNSFWSPDSSDLDRQITLDLGSDKTFNTMFLKWSLNDQDRWNRVKYKVEYSAAAAPTTWTLWANQSTSRSGFVEHALTSSATARYIRISVTGYTGVIALRDAKVYNITGSNADGRPNTTITRLITSIATAAGETKLRLAQTNQFLAAYTVEESTDPMDHIQKLAESIGWTWGYAFDGYLEAKPEDIDPTNPVHEYLFGEANILGFQPEYSGADIYNSIKVVGANTGTQAAITASASDSSPLSPTGIPNVGVKYEKIPDELANTQDKANERAKVLLWEKTHIPIPATFNNTANPAHDPGDVIRVTFDPTKTDDIFIINDFTISASNGFTMQCNLSQIVR